ncbi:hypothetical protein BB561_000562 [Smittium simulii]|uniref:Post-GPI attachment to proteins factor 3 n=1 Tax=Smittium simulii TaxID=133385 RepID=A0A2T9YYN3_9FUNG|nr:hypothetical protein BB561_000562 [Smittium simulii]
MDPIFHQVSFGLIMAFNFILGATHMRKLPPHSAIRNLLNKLLVNAFLGALIGFGAWNFDNVCCSSLRQTRILIGSPFNAILQMHAWWHIFTAYGCHCLAIFLITLKLELCGRSDYNVVFYNELPNIQFTKVKSI